MSRKRAEDKKHNLNVFLLKEGLNDFKEALKDEHILVEHVLVGADKTTSRLFVKASEFFPPKWLEFFEGFLEVNIEKVFNSSSSAVLFINSAGRVFVFSFGYGKSLLNLDLVEDNFGLRVALNSINVDKIRSVDIKNLDTVVRHSKVQTSQAGTFDNFGFNIDRDILNAVTGVSNDPDLGKRISGSTSFHLSISVKPDRLALLCEKLLKKFLDSTYKERFPWVDHISEVRNKTIIAELDLLLLKMIKERSFEQIFLSVPEIIDWEQVHGFKYGDKDKEVREDISIEDVLPRSAEESDKVNLPWLERKQILCIGANNDDVVNRWTLYKCLNCELKKGNEAFLLTAGKWFKIDTTYVKTVSEEIDQIPVYVNFPLLKSKGEKEAEYNKMVADSDTSRCVLMDKKLIPYGGGQNKIELCDLFVDKHDFIHVKRFRGSACLSHLFQQGHNAAFLLRAEMNFLKQANDKLPAGWKFDENKSINPSEYEVVFAVISKTKKQVRDVFPFFSKVSLQQVYKQLKVYGYKVSIAKIEMQ